MSNLTSYRNGHGSHHDSNINVEFLALDDKFRDEMKLLSETNEQLLSKTRSDPDMDLASASHSETRASAALAELRAENTRLRQRLREAEQLLEHLAGNEHTWEERQKEYEALLDEKSEVIRSLHVKLKETQEGTATGAASRAAENGEVRKLKEELEEQRLQLQEDEEALMQQMRQMELAMSRDRAELARQRNELQRMQAELNHEIEMAARDPGLREKLLSLQRRQQDTLARKGAGGPSNGASSNGAPARPEAAAQPAPTQADPSKSGFFGRLFGK